MSFSIKLISGLIQKGTNTFKLVKGKDVAFDQNNGALTSSDIDDNDIFLISDDSVTDDNDVKTITASNLKSYATASISASNIDSGTLSVARGGTNATSFADKSVIITQDSGTDTLSAVTMSTNGQLLIGGTDGPTAATLTQGSNVSITNGNGAITIAATDTNTQNTTTLSFVDSSNDIILRNTTGGATSGTDDIKFVAGSNITLTHTDADNITIAATDTQLSTEEVQDIAGPLVATGGTKTGITVTYDDVNNNMDFVVSGITASMLDSNIVSDLTELSSGIVSTDEILISDSGTPKRADISVLQSYMQSNLSFLTLTPSSESDPAAGVNSAIIIKEGATTTVAGKVYYLAPNGSWVLANATREQSMSGLLGVAVGTNSTTDGMVVKGVVVMSGHSGSAGNGKTIYLDTTDGAVTTSAPSSVRILGSIISHNSSRCEIYFNPDNFNGQAGDLSTSFTDNKSLTFDGTGDYAVASLPTDWGKSTGTFSFWVNLNITDDTSKYLVSFTTGDGSFNDFVLLQYYKVTTAKYAIICRQKRTISGVSTEHVTVAQQSSSYHGRPFARVSSDFTSIQQNYNSIRTSDTWTHIAVTWSNAVSSTYTYNGVTYNGNQTIYVNGTKVGEGTSTMPGHNASGTSNSMSQARVNNLNNVYLGTLSPSHGMANMVMNDLAIWSSALDADNITAIYNSGTPTDLTTGAGDYDEQGNLVGYWKMEDNGNDSSSNSNSLSLYADTTYVSDTPP